MPVVLDPPEWCPDGGSDDPPGSEPDVGVADALGLGVVEPPFLVLLPFPPLALPLRMPLHGPCPLLSHAGGPRGYSSGGVFGVLPWLLLGNMMGGRSSMGTRGSGGFGGFDSGDSFGGFGGGDSGGGGASSDW